MNKICKLLAENPKVSDYKINEHKKESYELFFVKGKLETIRCTDTCDKEVTVYADHAGFKGHSQFFVYPSTTEEQLRSMIEDAADKAMLIDNQHYDLPGQETGTFEVGSNFGDFDPADLAAAIANGVFEANQIPNASLNSVEVFINKHTQTIQNSRGLHKTQVRYDAMVEAIPTYNGEDQSVELYEQYNFSSFNPQELTREIAEKMEEVKARYEAVTPDFSIECPVVLKDKELGQLFWNIADHFDYASVYGKYNLYEKGDLIQKAPTGDKIGITMAGQIPGSTRSSCFDADGLTLGSIRIVENGKAINRYGSNRFGQYLGEQPTGDLPCIRVDAGTAGSDAFAGAKLEVVSMSGLQVDFYSDYIGGEVRLAYYHDGSKIIPVTGISISGKISEVLESIQLSAQTSVHGSYQGPSRAVLNQMKIF